MKFDHAWTLAGKPRGETPAPPPGKRPPVLPRLLSCRVLFRQTGKRILRAMLAAGRRPHLAFGEHGSSPGVRQLAAQPKRHNRAGVGRVLAEGWTASDAAAQLAKQVYEPGSFCKRASCRCCWP